MAKTARNRQEGRQSAGDRRESLSEQIERPFAIRRHRRKGDTVGPDTNWQSRTRRTYSKVLGKKRTLDISSTYA